MKSFSLFVSLFLVLLLASGCRTPLQEKKENKVNNYKYSFIEANKYTRERNRELIQAFINRTAWDMKETSTGLWYKILDPGTGEHVEEGRMIYYSYQTRLINGTICYTADTINPKKIVVGKGNIESGLEEGLLLLREKSRARFIIPPYLAHGNFGDMDKIPGSAILIIDVHVLEVKR